VTDLLFWLIVGHCLADYPLQGDFLARAKNHKTPVLAANGQPFPWQLALAAHALIHGGMVALITRSIAAGVTETVLHLWCDYETSDGRNSYWGDQCIHLVHKIVYVLLIAHGIITT